MTGAQQMMMDQNQDFLDEQLKLQYYNQGMFTAGLSSGLANNGQGMSRLDQGKDSTLSGPTRLQEKHSNNSSS